jgi:glycosyltransferase involved in cell wall biosynthesis
MTLKSIVIFENWPLEGNSLETKPLGGSEIAITTLSRELVKLGYNVSVLSKCSNPGKYHGVQYYSIDRAKELLEEKGCDIFLSQSYPPIFDLNIKAKKKIFYTGASYTVRGMKPLKEAFLQNKIDHFFFVSKWQADHFQREFLLDPKKIYITKNGFDPSLLDPKIKKEKFRMVYFSSPSRGLDVLLSIFPKIRKRYPSCELHIFSDYEFYGHGKGSGATEHPEIYKKLEQPNVVSRGNILHSELVREVQRASILAYPSHFEETSCMAAIESQATGTVPVTTGLAALNETVKDNETGILIKGNSRSLFYKWKYLRSIYDLFSNERKWRALSEAGISRMKKEYTWSGIALEWDKFFKEHS